MSEKTVVDVHPLAAKPGASAQDRFLVGFSDGTTLKTTLSVVADHHLRTGRVLTAEEYAAVCGDTALAATKQRALRIIGTRSFSSQELYDRLLEKGEDPHHSASAVAWLCELHLLDDAEYAGTMRRKVMALRASNRNFTAGRFPPNTGRMHWHLFPMQRRKSTGCCAANCGAKRPTGQN